MISGERKALMFAQNRAEELLLALVAEKLMAHKPLRPNEMEEPVTDQYKGYYDGWWDAVQQLSDIIDNHIEGNESRL